MSIWKRVFRRGRLDDDLVEEIRAHLRMAAQDRIERGETPADAELHARRELGNPLLVRETTRDVWGWAALESLGQDLRFALRQVTRSPGFTAIAIVTLALGLGATTTMFSIVNGALLRPLELREPERLYVAESIPPARAATTRRLPVNARHYHEWRMHCASCEEVALLQGMNLTLVGAGEPVQLPALSVSANFFRAIGVQPILGRDFLEREAQGFGVVILADKLWRTHFAADPAIVGRAIQLNGESHTVLGVMPAGLHLPRGEQWGAYVGPPAVPEIFRPMGNFAPQSPVGNLNYTSVIRLKPGVRPEQATAELNALLAEFVREFKLEGRIALTPLQEQVTRGGRGPLWLFMGAVGTVLLIVCVNTGNLMLVRTAGRYREAGVRMALGASRLRLFRLVLMEAFVLVAAGGIAGLGLAHLGLKVFMESAPLAIPRLDEVRMDWRVLLFSMLVLAFSMILCGLFPAWRLSSIEPQESLKSGAANTTETGGKLRLRETLVGLEVALSTVLLMLAGLLMLSFIRVMRVDKGFAVAHVVTQDVSFLSPKYGHGVRRGFAEELIAKLARIPGVQAVGAISQLPLQGETWVSGLRDADQQQNTWPDTAIANFRFVTPQYAKAMGIPVKQGRFLEDPDRNRPVAVISERAARYLWPNQDAIGRHVRGAGIEKPSLQVVGIVGEVRGNLENDPPMMVYEHFWRMQPVAMSFVLRTQANPAPVVAAVRSILSAADPKMAISKARTMEQIVEESLAARRFQTYLAMAFAFSALMLASLGIYGVISFAVARRTPEMGIRIALGARRQQLMAMVIRRGMAPVLLGLGAGMISGLFVSRLIASQLYGVAPHDPATMASATFVLLAVALLACWIPARRATKIDPLEALRFE